MHEKGKDKELIAFMIQKRKQEIDAFTKLLNAIETKGNESNENTKPKRKTKKR